MAIGDSALQLISDAGCSAEPRRFLTKPIDLAVLCRVGKSTCRPVIRRHMSSDVELG